MLNIFVALNLIPSFDTHLLITCQEWAIMIGTLRATKPDEIWTRLHPWGALSLTRWKAHPHRARNEVENTECFQKSPQAEMNLFHLQMLGWLGPYGSAQPIREISQHISFSLEHSPEQRDSQHCNFILFSERFFSPTSSPFVLVCWGSFSLTLLPQSSQQDRTNVSSSYCKIRVPFVCYFH